MHEVGHNWFYGILGSNERSYPWMDEGLNSHNENRYMRTKYPEYKGNIICDILPERLERILDIEDYNNKDTQFKAINLNLLPFTGTLGNANNRLFGG